MGPHHTDVNIAAGSTGDATGTASAQSYRRMLDIDRAVHEVHYTRDGTTYHRTYFCSYPAQMMVLRFTADKRAAYTGRISLVDAHQAKSVAEGNRITLAGSLAGYVYSSGSSRGRTDQYDLALQYESQLLVLNEGGTLEAVLGPGSQEAEGGKIRIDDCFSRREAREHFSTYVEGQLSDLGEKSCEPIALAAGVPPRNLQEFLGAYKWDEARWASSTRPAT